MRTGNWMQTYTGKAYYPTDPHPDDVCIEDIAHALSQICRYAGHCKKFYSVAEHSYYVSLMVPPEHALQGLLHDAAEAYCQDIPRPLKHSSEMRGYRAIEHLNHIMISAHFGLNNIESPEVKQADNDVLLVEYRALFDGEPPLSWHPMRISDRMWDFDIKALAPPAAETLFLRRFKNLTKGKAK